MLYIVLDIDPCSLRAITVNLKLMLNELKKLLTGDVDGANKTRQFYSHDTSLFEVVPDVVTFPKNTSDIQKLVRFVNKHKKEHPTLSLTGRSGGTDMSGGAINDSIIVVFEKYFKDIGTIRHSSVDVEPGVYYRDFEKFTLQHDLIMPSYPASREICAIGGMINNNAGGEKSLSYGKTEEYVNSLNVVLADGEEYVIKPLDKAGLKKKMSQTDFEGQLYKKIFKLIDDNYDEIKKAKPPVSKNSTAYNLWNVWDREKEIFDLTQLFVGSQGTLGLMTKVNMRLVDYKPKSGMLIGYAHSLDNMAETINVVVNHRPTSFETFDEHTTKFAFKFFFQFRKTLGWKEFIKLGISFIPDLLFFRKGIPKFIFLAEFEGEDSDEILTKLHNLRGDLEGLGLDIELAPTKKKEKRFWLMRRESFNLLRKNVKNKHTAPFIDDLVVVPEHLPEFLPELREILDKYELLYTIAGHMGDGNFHIIPLMDLTLESEREKIEPCLMEVIKLVKKYDGTISGEHNDGLIRGPFIDNMYGKSMYKHFKEVKQIFDPDNIFNPHKKTDAKWRYSKEHIRDHF